MKSRQPNLDWIRKVLVEEEAVIIDLQAPLVPIGMPDESEPAQTARERVNAARPVVLRLVK